LGFVQRRVGPTEQNPEEGKGKEGEGKKKKGGGSVARMAWSNFHRWENGRRETKVGFLH